jgi:PAS domain S-box-containing protein
LNAILRPSLPSREELLKVVKSVPAGVAILDSDMRYLQVSDRWCADYCIDSSQVLGRSYYEVFPDLPERWKEMHRRCLKGETLRAEENDWDRKSGTKKSRIVNDRSPYHTLSRVLEVRAFAAAIKVGDIAYRAPTTTNDRHIRFANTNIC